MHREAVPEAGRPPTKPNSMSLSEPRVFSQLGKHLSNIKRPNSVQDTKCPTFPPSLSVHSSQCKAWEGCQKDKPGKNTKLVLVDLV